MKPYKNIILIILFIYILSGCQVTNNNNQLPVDFHTSRQESKNVVKGKFQTESLIVPLQVKANSFYTIIDWINDKEIVALETESGNTTAFTYNIKTGTKTTILTTTNPIITASISPSGEYLLTHSSPETFQAKIDVYNLNNFEKIFEHTFESSEITYEWNPYKETEIFLTAFYEDWTYHSFLLKTNQNQVDELILKQPFAVWFDSESLAMLNWINEGPELTAPLVVSNQVKETRIFGNKEFYYLDSWKDTILVIGTDEENDEYAEMSFFDIHQQLLSSFKTPHLIKYSGWQIPYYDYISSKQDFFMIEPRYSTLSEMHNENYQLTKRNIITGESEVIFESILNQPINCSPNGENCLYGYQFENIILVNNKEIKTFIEQ